MILLRIFSRPEIARDILVVLAYVVISTLYFLLNGLLPILPCEIFCDTWTLHVSKIFCENNHEYLPLGSFRNVSVVSLVILYFLLRRIAPVIAALLKIFHLLELIFRFLFIPCSIICSYIISLRQCKRIATIEAYRATDCIFTSYMLGASVCYLFLIIREQFNEKEMVSFISLL